MHYNPLLIKWFVQAVGKGTRPEDVLSHEDLGQALRFCLGNVYARLSHLSVEIISALLAARRSLSQPQLQELLDAGHISLVEALQELQQSNIVERSVEPDSSAVYQIGSLVLDYLSRYHPPDDTAVKRTRDKLKHWQQEQDRSAVQQNTYRYGRKAILIDSNDERIAAPHLRNALNMMHSNDTANAHKSLERAQELTPQWWEVHRVKAHVLEMEKRPIYEIEQAFEESINCEDTDVNRFHYAVYLMRIEEYEKALEQIGRAADHQAADDLALRSIKGLVLLRNGRIPEALEELEYVWNCEDTGTPMNIKRVRGTQLAGALHRRVEQLYNLGNTSAAEEIALKGVNVVNQTALVCGWDWKLAESGVELLSELLRRPDTSSSSKFRLTELAVAWDSDVRYRDACRSRGRTQGLIERNEGLLGAMPNFSSTVASLDRAQRFTGVVKRITFQYGFIQTDSLGDVHMNQSSLVRPSTWQDLGEGQKVVFGVTYGGKIPHAVELEPDSETT